MNEGRLLAIALVFAPLSLISFGGGQAIIAEMQHQVVDIHKWMSGPEFADLFALSRAAPGPSTLIAAHNSTATMMVLAAGGVLGTGATA